MTLTEAQLYDLGNRNDVHAAEQRIQNLEKEVEALKRKIAVLTKDYKRHLDSHRRMK